MPPLLQYYIVFEVLEPNWAKLMGALPQCADLDAVIQLHEGTLQVGLAAAAQAAPSAAALFAHPIRMMPRPSQRSAVPLARRPSPPACFWTACRRP